MNYRDFRISIITVTFQAVKTLRATIESVLKQDPVFEYIIIDGGSTDGTLDIIKEYEHKISYWASEPDDGIYDAMNKGVIQAKSQWLYFLGADDIILPDVLREVCVHLSNRYVLLFGDVLIEGKVRVNSYLNRRTLLQNTLHHQGAFYNKHLFKHFLYNTKLKILSDYELNLKIYIENLPTYKLSTVIASCSAGGASSDFSTSLKETNAIRKLYVKNRASQVFLSEILRAYYLQKSIRKFLHKEINRSKNMTGRS